MEDTDVPEKSAIEQLRDEMNAQYAALKASFEQSSKEKDDKITALESENKDLKTALLKSAFTERPEPEPTPKSDEELYAEKINALYEKSKIYSEMI